MKNIISCLLLITTCSYQLFAQDQIHLINKIIVEAKVVAVSKQTITYKKQSNLNGPIYNLSPLEIWYIQYENGSIDSFSDVTTNESSRKISTGFKHYNNIITLHPFALIGNVAIDSKNYYAGLSYERIMANGSFGAKGIFRTGLEAGLFSGGLQSKWYPTGQGSVKYFLGIGSEIFAFQNDSYFGPAQNNTSVYFTNGLSINATNRFNISAEANIGNWFTGLDDQALFYILGIGFGVRF